MLTKIMLLPVGLLVVGDLTRLFGGGGFSTLFIVVGTIISILAALALIFALQDNIQPGESYRSVLRRFWPYVWLTILSGFVTLGGFVMLIIPGILFSVWFAFALYVFAGGNDKGMNALLRSREYVQGRWWQVFLRWLVLVLGTLVIIAVLGVLAKVFFGEAGKNLFSDLFLLVYAPFMTAYLYELYQNLKSLKPEVATQPPQGPRGFFYFSAVLGVVGLIVLAVVMVVAAAYFLSGGLGPDMLQ